MSWRKVFKTNRRKALLTNIQEVAGEKKYNFMKFDQWLEDCIIVHLLKSRIL